MTDTALIETPSPTLTAAVELTHVVCCIDDDLTLCGADGTDMVWDEDAPTDCVVCADLDDTLEATDSCATVCPKLWAVAS